MNKTLSGVNYQLLPEGKIQKYVKEVAEKEWENEDFKKYGDLKDLS